MHPMVLESLTQQRLQDLRSGISQRPHCQSTEASPSHGQTPAAGSEDSVRVGPVGRTQAKMGLWMVETGSRMVRSVGVDPGAVSGQGRRTDDGDNSPATGDRSSTHKAA